MAAALQRDSIEKCPTFHDVITRAASYPAERVAETALALLDLRRDHAVLELGCGSGRLLTRVAAQVQQGLALGIDPSPLMVRHARMRVRRFVERGFAAIEPGSSEDLSHLPAERFDRVYGLHVACFWRTPGRDLAEIRRVLAPGGRLLLGFPPSEHAPSGIVRDRAWCSIASVERWLTEAGFRALAGVTEWIDGLPLAWLTARI
jgi:SAM-dependent methyltransferase